MTRGGYKVTLPRGTLCEIHSLATISVSHCREVESKLLSFTSGRVPLGSAWAPDNRTEPAYVATMAVCPEDARAYVSARDGYVQPPQGISQLPALDTTGAAGIRRYAGVRSPGVASLNARTLQMSGKQYPYVRRIFPQFRDHNHLKTSAIEWCRIQVCWLDDHCSVYIYIQIIE